PLVPAFWVWVSAQVAALIGCWVWLARRFGPDALVFSALYFPTSVGIYNGQDPVWMLAIFLGCYALAEQKRDLASGAVLGLAVVKFHLLFLMPLVLALEKRWRMLGGFCVTGALCAAVSVELGGPGIVTQYAALLLRHGNVKTFEPPAELQMSIRSIALNAGLNSPLLAAALIGLCILVLLAAAWRAPLWRWFSAACAATLLVSPHVYRYDAGILLLPISLAIFCSASRFTRIAAATAAIPVPYMAAFFGPPYSMAPALVVFLFLAALAWESAAEKRQPASSATSLSGAKKCTSEQTVVAASPSPM
ncbi:MAG: glycosyltransferase family 87 protein, partial [Bryobacteraceae bacterium]